MDDVIQPLTCCTAHSCALTFTGLCRTCVSKAKVNIKLRVLVISCVWPLCPSPYRMPLSMWWVRTYYIGQRASATFGLQQLIFLRFPQYLFTEHPQKEE